MTLEEVRDWLSSISFLEIITPYMKDREAIELQRDIYEAFLKQQKSKTKLRTIEGARKIIAALAEQEKQYQFAREVRAGCWDHRSDVQAARRPGFKPRSLNRTPLSYEGYYL